MQRKTFTGTIASVSALGIRNDMTNELETLSISVLIPVSYVNDKPLREAIWTNIILSPEEAQRLGLEIKAKSLKTSKQFISPQELAKYGLNTTETGTVGLTISYDAVGLNKANARELNSPGLPPRTVYPASSVTNVHLDTADSLMTEFDVVENVTQTKGYRPPSAVSNFVNQMFNREQEKSNVQSELIDWASL